MVANYHKLSPDGGTSSPVSLAMQNHRTIRYVMIFGILCVTIFLYVCYYTTPIMPEMTSHHFQTSNTQPLYQTPRDRQPEAAESNHKDQNFFVLATNASINASTVFNTSNSSLMISSGNGISIGGPPSDLIAIPENTTADAKLPQTKTKVEVAEIVDETKNEIPKDELGSSIMSVLESKKQEIETKLIVIPKVDPPSKKEISKLNAQNGTKKVELDPTNGIRTSDIYERGHTDASIDICPEQGEGIYLLILITSAPSHRDARLAIRQTWGHYGTRRDTSVAFFVGATQDEKMESDLSGEGYIYGDLIRGNSIDSYNNLTLKTISMLEWVDEFCSRAKFILKTDDDMFINVPKLMQFIEKHQNEKRHIFGRLAKKWKPIRNRKSKYYVSPKQYSPKYFPDFTTGPAYLMTQDVVHDLYEMALNQTYLKLEDVYTTGIVAEMVKVKRSHVTEFLNRRVGFNPCTIKKAISVHMVKGKEQFDLWKKLMDPSLKCK